MNQYVILLKRSNLESKSSTWPVKQCRSQLSRQPKYFIISGGVQLEDADSLYEELVDGTIDKPFSSELLTDALAPHLEALKKTA